MFEVRAHKCGWHNREKVRFKVNAAHRFSLKITISNKHSHGSKDQGGWFTLQALQMSLFWLRVYMQWLGWSLSNEMSVSSNWVDSSENSVFCRLCLPRNLKVFALETQLLSLHFALSQYLRFVTIVKLHRTTKGCTTSVWCIKFWLVYDINST